MTDRQWGFAGRVGSWEGRLDIPIAKRQPPIAAALYLLERFIPVLAELHRPRRMLLSWGEYDNQGQQIDAHEEVELSVDTWESIPRSLAALAEQTPYLAALMSIFIYLDTSLRDGSSEIWSEQSALCQISLTPPWFEPTDAVAIYTTYIDVWLSTTYGHNYVPRSNRNTANQNRPRLEAFLNTFAAIAGPTYRTGHSQLYPFAITPTGFRDADNLPPRVGEPGSG